MTDYERPVGWASMADLMEENRRLKKAVQPVGSAVQPVGARATLFVVCIVVLAVLMAAFVVAISMARPNADNMPLIIAVSSVVVPIITALLAATVQQVHLAVNSRLSQLLDLTAKSSRAEGQLVGLMEPTPGSESTARAEGKAAGVEQERVRTEKT